MYKRQGGVKTPLYCGGPRYSSEPKWGERHIKAHHQDDWERSAFGTDLTWRQLADISINSVLSDPYVKGPIVNDKRCYSRYVYKWDYRRKKVVDFIIVRVIFKTTGSRKIITAYPSKHCGQ